MSTEIELKLFFLPQYQASLITLLDALPGAQAMGEQHLTNGYFDTRGLQLRQWDMGLRVRGCDGHREQTIKTAGRVVGGIHSRPEYNVTIDADEPCLALFPTSIWPEGADIARVQNGLSCLFHTDFVRRRWHVQLTDSLIEVALDIGHIRAGSEGAERNEALCELEFELLQGKPADLLSLAMLVAAKVPVRLGKASKAQRGYRLAEQASPLMLDALDYISLPPEGDLRQTLQTLLETALERWQLLEAMIAESTMDPLNAPALWQRLRACLRLLRLTLGQFTLLDTQFEMTFDDMETRFGFIEPALAIGAMLKQHKALTQLPQGEALVIALEDELTRMDLGARLQALWQLPLYGQLQLRLVELLLKVTSVEFSLSKDVCVKDFADGLQQASWERILALMPQGRSLGAEDYLQLARPLEECVLVGLAYGSLYKGKARDAFRGPWLDLQLGITTLAGYAQLASIGGREGIQLAQWLKDKRSSLLFAMEHSRRSALNADPYWG